MKYWSRFPVFRVLIPFSTGIIFYINTNGQILFFLVVTIITAFLSWLFTTRNYASGKFATRWLAGIPFYVCFFASGYVLTWFNNTIHYSDHFIPLSNESFYTVTISKPPAENAGGYRIIAEVTAQKIDTSWEVSRGNLLLYLRDSSHTTGLKVGDKIIIKGKPSKVLPPLNPDAFDYSRYLESKGISYQCFLSKENIEILELYEGFSLLNTADNFRKKLLGILEENLRGHDRLGVAGALLLGYEEWLDPELEMQYSAAGVLHILCVSGMHVGLIYLIFSWSLSWMKSNRYLNHFQYPVMIALIWFYSLVTGMAPSIIRAATMISFMIGGKWLDKNSNIYNVLCSSCIVMFAFDPYLIISAGFQLSFLAVCGIVVFHKMIFPLWIAPNKFLHKAWELISISIAAQLTTFPLSLYMFHQFPNYFLLGNILLIPLSTFVMYAGIILLTFNWIPYIGKIAAFLTSHSIDFLNYLVGFISELPGALTENITISLSETILLYLLMLAFTLWLIIKTRTWLFNWMLIIIAIFTLRIYALLEISGNSEFTVYHHKNSSIYSFIENRNAIIINDSAISKNQLDFALKGHLIKNMVTKTNQILLDSLNTGHLINQNILLIKNWKFNSVPESGTLKNQISILILGGNVSVRADTILKYFNPEVVVIDPSVKFNQTQRLGESFAKKGIKVHLVKKSGAFRLPI